MTNKEYLDEKGTCIYDGNLGYIEAIIRIRCLFNHIEFTDETIIEWMEAISNRLEDCGYVSVYDAMQLSIGVKYARPYDEVRGITSY